ncbi:HPr kinase [Tistrella mobilis]|nr:HPr kinase [Tistrella mobilis]
MPASPAWGAMPAVAITAGPLPPLPDAPPLDAGPLIRIEADRSIRLTGPIGGACHLDAAATRAVIDTTGAADPAAARLLLAEDMLPGLACHIHGLLPVSGTAVVIGGRAVLITGVSGSGKSLLAAELLARGHHLLADGIVVLSGLPGPALILPGPAGLTLHADASARSADRLDGPPPQRRRAAVPRLRHLPTAQHTAPLPVTAIFHLWQTIGGSDLEVLPARGLEGFQTMEGNVRQLHEGRILRGARPIFAGVAALLGHVPLIRLRHRRDWQAPARLADHIEAMS